VAEPWRLARLDETYDAWVDQEEPTVDLRFLVLRWVMSRTDNPFAGARRQRGFPNLWFAVIPQSVNEDGAMVTSTYWVEAADRVVRFDMFATLRPPFIDDPDPLVDPDDPAGE
jgi:hypothetical protein